MDRLEAMGVFMSVVEHGSLSAAGRKLGMPLATVSRKLSDLETHLKARLLNRSTRGLTLTDSGRDYLSACKRILEDVTEAERAAAGEFSEPRGELVITAPLVMGRMHVLPVVVEFLAAYPEIKVRLIQGDRIAQLHEEQIDLAVRVGELPDSRLTATRIGTIRRVVCAHPEYFSAYGLPSVPRDLADHRCVTFDAINSTEVWRFPVDGAEVAVPVRSALVVNTAEAAIDAAIAGVGVTRVLSYQIEEWKRRGRLQTVLREFEPPAMPASLVYTGQRRLPLKLRAFLDYATPRLRERLATAD
ncbi:LysR family transcriptional regulator [Luteimonas sp. SJ-92]|uniref:LysR family transcriptional regulator n=1 Tax=Luteimonas salinisoli TaxID=2752307 RepID=A0A853JD69_9GAMM|nr:LysR family transcriptional regulator [Luteimonas salinisoli]NZA26518.1 LysR family transcriptional regulator [Luteimonas salinisoli]